MPFPIRKHIPCPPSPLIAVLEVEPVVSCDVGAGLTLVWLLLSHGDRVFRRKRPGTLATIDASE